MNEIGIIASVIAAIAAIITLVFTIRNSKGNVIKRIERKQRQIQDITFQFSKTYGVNANISQHYPTSMKVQKLQNDIQELQKKI